MVLARRRGLSFEEWWEEAVRPDASLVMTTHPNPPEGAVRWPTDKTDREAWRAATIEAKSGWRRAYEQARPSRAEEAIAFLADAIGALANPEELAAFAEPELQAA